MPLDAVSAPSLANPFAPGGDGRSRTARAAGEDRLSAEEQRSVSRLQQRDREVRAHELSHLAAGAGLARGGPTYAYERGPDGRLYAVGGEVSIDTAPGRTPEETIERARQIRSAALAPAEPSPQDHRVAAQASQMEVQARLELAATQRDESLSGNADGATTRRVQGYISDSELAPAGRVIDTYA